MLTVSFLVLRNLKGDGKRVNEDGWEEERTGQEEVGWAE